MTRHRRHCTGGNKSTARRSICRLAHKLSGRVGGGGRFPTALPGGAVGGLFGAAVHTGASVGAVVVRTGGTPSTITAGPIRGGVLHTGLTGTGTAVGVKESSQAIRAIPTGAIGAHVVSTAFAGTSVGIVFPYRTRRAGPT